MKRKILSIVLCFTLVFGCCAAFSPMKVDAKKFSKKKVKLVVKKCKGKIYLPEDDISCKEFIMITNKNKQLADVSFTITYYNGKTEVFGATYFVCFAQLYYMGIGNEEEMKPYTSYKIKFHYAKKFKAKQIPKKKVIIKKVKKGKISIKNKSKYNGLFERARIYYKKKGKVVAVDSTCYQEIKAGKKVTINDMSYKGKYYKKKTYYNYFEKK